MHANDQLAAALRSKGSLTVLIKMLPIPRSCQNGDFMPVYYLLSKESEGPGCNPDLRYFKQASDSTSVVPANFAVEHWDYNIKD